MADDVATNAEPTMPGALAPMASQYAFNNLHSQISVASLFKRSHQSITQGDSHDHDHASPGPEPARRLSSPPPRRRLQAQAQPLILSADPDAGLLRVRHAQAHSAVEHAIPYASHSPEEIALPLEALVDFAANSNEMVTLESNSPRRASARWQDRGIPQFREYSAPAPASDRRAGFPQWPASFQPCSPGLLDALAEACVTADEPGSVRYALECLQLQGDCGQVIATDGRQLLIQSGFSFPWSGDVLIRRTPLLAQRHWAKDRPIEIGKTEAHVVLRIGEWTLWLAIQTNVRYPRVEQITSAAEARIATLRLATEDAEFLSQSLDRLPGGEDAEAPITLDLSGQAVIRARAEGETQVAELLLSRSICVGSPIRVSMNRRFARRALQLGFAEMAIAGVENPVSCRDERRLYIWQPLTKDGVIELTADAVRIESRCSTGAVPPAPKTERTIPAFSVREVALKLTTASASALTVARVAPLDGENLGGGVGLASLIQEAESMRQTLGEAKDRMRRLIVALRRERKRARLVQSTLATLRQLRLSDAVE